MARLPLTWERQGSLGDKPHSQPPRPAWLAHVDDDESGHDQILPDRVGFTGRFDIVVKVGRPDDGDGVWRGLKVEHPSCWFGQWKETERIIDDQVGRIEAGHLG